MSYIIKNHIFDACGPKETQDIQTQYLRAMLAGAIYGIVEQWIKLGMNELPKKINIESFMKIAVEYKVVEND